MLASLSLKLGKTTSGVSLNAAVTICLMSSGSPNFLLRKIIGMPFSCFTVMLSLNGSVLVSIFLIT